MLRGQTDERLVDLVRAGNEPAFEAIVARYRRPLLRYCSGILSEERAEDAVQQTFVKAYEAMRRDGSPLALRPWLYRIAHNTALNELRDKSLRHEPLDPQIDGVERPDQATERRQGIREVLAAVQALPSRQRDAIVLRELQGRSYAEIAGTLGVTGGAVRQLLSRARMTLRAGVTAITPFGLLVRLPFPDRPVDGRVAELVTGAGAAAVAAKVGAAVLVTGAVAGSVAGVPDFQGAQEPQATQPPQGLASAGSANAHAGSARTEAGEHPGRGDPVGNRGAQRAGPLTDASEGGRAAAPGDDRRTREPGEDRGRGRDSHGRRPDDHGAPEARPADSAPEGHPEPGHGPGAKPADSPPEGKSSSGKELSARPEAPEPPEVPKP